MDMATYCSSWGISDIEPLASTAMGHLFKASSASGSAVLKVASNTGLRDHLGAVVALAWWDGNGAVRVFRHDESAMLMERLDGGMLVDLVEAGQDNEATLQLGLLLQRLHACGAGEQPQGITTLEDFLGEARLEGRAEEVAAWLLATQPERVLLHGDLHHNNVLRCRERDAWLAIDPKGLWGERAFDAAAFLLSPMTQDTRDSGILARRVAQVCEVAGLDPRRVLGYPYLEAVGIAAWAGQMGWGMLQSHMSAMAGLILSFLDEGHPTPATGNLSEADPAA